MRSSKCFDMLLVAVAGYGTPGDHAASRDAGFNLHLTKPVNLDELQALLEVHAGVAMLGSAYTA